MRCISRLIETRETFVRIFGDLEALRFGEEAGEGCLKESKGSELQILKALKEFGG